MAITKQQKKRAFSLAAIGVLLTFMCVTLDAGGWLNFMESYLYDKRMAWCQRYSLIRHPPTDRVIHLDIDDESQETIGKWPWPRRKIAQIVDEIGNAGGKVLFTDILFTDIARDANGNPDVGGDVILSASIQRMGHVLAPMSVQLLDVDDEFIPLSRRMLDELTPNPEMTVAELTAHMKPLADRDPTFIPPRETLESAVESRFMKLRQVALYRRATAEIDKGVTDKAKLRELILPHQDAMISSSPIIDVLNEQYEFALREKEMRRFKLPVPPIPNLARGNHDFEQIPILEISSHAAYSGFVDPFSVGDKRLRSVVLGIESEGKLLPHASLAMTCALLGADIQKVQFTKDTVTIVLPDGRKYVVPVRTAQSDSGRTVPLVFDIPWWGSPDWKTMYDWPHFTQSVRHASVNVVGEVLHSEDVIRINKQVLNDSVEALILNIQGSKAVEVFDANPLEGEALDKLTAQLMDTAKQQLDMLDEKTFNEMEPNDKKLMTLMKKAYVAIPLARQKMADAIKDLQKQRNDLRKLLSGNLVLMGWTATAAFDFYPTPLHDRCPGVVALSTIVNGIITGRTYRTLPHGWTLIFTILTGLITTSLVVTLTPLRSSIYTSGLAMVYFTVNGYVIYDRYQSILGLAGPSAAMLSVWTTLTIIKFTVEIRDRNRLKKRFQSYVDPKLVNYVLEHPDDAGTSGAVKEMSVVFTDLEGFTTLSEALKEKTVPMLSEYMGEMVPLIRSHNGYVNKFLGDGIMFFFNPPCAPDPDHAADAVMAVLDMQRAMIPFNEKLRSQGLPTLNMRVGIVSGDMVVGDAGPENASDYTVLGDNVNLASRLEGANKMTGTNTMIHWRTKELLGDRFLCRPIGKLMVKGKTEGVMIFEPLGPTILVDDRQRQIVDCSEKIVQAYVAADFDACRAACDEMDREIGPSKFTKLYREEAALRKEEFKNDGEHVKNFSGVITLSEK